MVEERDGWYVVNVKDARWFRSQDFGLSCTFEKEGVSFPHTGAHIFILEPGKPNCRYHREEAQEDILVLAGRCKLLVNGEERTLQTWDYVHLPPGTSHVCVGEEDAPCAILIIGHRAEKERIFYPASELARRYNAEAPEPTDTPSVAYSDTDSRKPTDPPEWPLG